jgi:ElaB/YqjD/DUF883 family membrane-anchored ribosome-binding protein
MNTIESTPASTSTPGSLRQADAAADATRDAASSLIDNLRSAAKDAAGVLRRDAHHSKDVAERYIGSNPWRAAAMIGAAGLLLGAVLTRRR